MQQTTVQSPQKQEYIHNETARKESLLLLFDVLEDKERRVQKGENKDKKYERMFRGTAIVTKIYETELHLSRFSGKVIGSLAITKEISAHFRLGDQLEITMGLRGTHWRSVYLLYVASQLPFQLDDQ